MTPWLRSWLRWFWAAFLKCSGLLWWTRLQLGAESGVVVLTFHRVVPDGIFNRADSLRGIMVRRRTFERLLEYLASRYAVLPADAAPDAARLTGQLAVALTFDDGWSDNLTEALPVLKRHHLPSTLFVCTGLAGRRQPFWPERLVAVWRAGSRDRKVREMAVAAIQEGGGHRMPFPDGMDSPEALDYLVEEFKRMDPARRDRVMAEMQELAGSAIEEQDTLNALLDWTDIAVMDAAGVAIGSHTVSHQILTQIPGAEARREIGESRIQVVGHLDKECRLFSYPNGDVCEAVRAQVAEAGYRLAFTTRPGLWTEQTDPFLIPRINVWEGKLTNPWGGFSKLMFEYAVFWKARAACQGPGARVTRRSPLSTPSGARRSGCS